MLNTGDRWSRLQAATAVAELGGRAAMAVPALTELLKDADRYTRYDVALALGKIGTEAKSAVPALKQLLDDREWTVRLAVARALNDHARRAWVWPASQSEAFT
jgi:HEAT repeat protein